MNAKPHKGIGLFKLGSAFLFEVLIHQHSLQLKQLSTECNHGDKLLI